MIEVLRSHFLLAIVLVGAALAQQPAPSPMDPAAPAKRTGCLRAWIFPGTQQTGDFSLTTTAPDGSAMSLAAGAAPANETFYRDLPPGKYSLDFKDGEKVLAQKQVQVSASSYQTIVVWCQGGKWNMELYSDSAAPAAAGQRPLRLLNFAGKAVTTVAIAGLPTPIKLPPDSVKEVQLPRKNAALDITSQLPGGPAARNAGEVDLSLVPAAYVLVAPDYRGRLRPQFLGAGDPTLAVP